MIAEHRSTGARSAPLRIVFAVKREPFFRIKNDAPQTVARSSIDYETS